MTPRHGGETELAESAVAVQRELRGQMEELGVDVLDGAPRSAIAEVRRPWKGGRRQELELTWRNNGVRVPVTGSWTAIEAFVEEADHLFATLADARRGEALAESWAQRMRAAGIEQIAAPGRSRLLRLVVDSDGRGLWFTWAGNRQTCRLHGNVGACLDVLRTARGWERSLNRACGAREAADRQAWQRAQHGRETLRRFGRGVG